MELRCENKILHGIIEDGFLDVKCRSSRCGARRGVVVIHRFSISSWVLLETKVYQDPANTRKVGEQNGSGSNSVAFRAP
jgi:hypothetical protein